MGDFGPVWTRKFRLEHSKEDFEDFDEGFTEKNLERFRQGLIDWGVDRVVVGHSITPDKLIMTHHPVFGSQVVMIDTAISSAYGYGNLSALEIKDHLASPIRLKRHLPNEIEDQIHLSSIRAQFEKEEWYRDLQKEDALDFEKSEGIENEFDSLKCQKTFDNLSGE